MIGTRLGPYCLERELGSGGMGSVYRATVVEPAAGLDVGATVALKVVHPHLLLRQGFLARFRREAQIGKSVRDPNVVRTYELRACRDGCGATQHVLAMECVEGGTLRALLDELGPLPEELCRHVGREVARGLVAIHAAGVVHRDLKPENVLITPDHTVKIMDLGVAHLQDEAIRLSRTGGFVGSLRYAAPEQVRGAHLDLDGRTDLYALGTMLYELSTGRHPLLAPDDDVPHALRAILEEVPRPISAWNPRLSPFLEEVVRALLAKERDGRFASARDLLGVLEAGEASAWWKEVARSLRAEGTRTLRRVRVPRETALRGRDEDLAVLDEAWRAAAEGRGTALLIEGEAGVGKSRLIEEFVDRLGARGEAFHALSGSHPPGGGAGPGGALAIALREHFGAEEPERAIAPYLRVARGLAPAVAAWLRGEAVPSSEAFLRRDALLAALAEILGRLADECPTVLVVEDLHFAGEDGRALFTGLVHAVRDRRLLVVGTLRPEVPTAWAASLGRLDLLRRHVLRRLGPRSLIELVQDASGSLRLVEAVGAEIARRSDGNPFFALEILRGLREQGRIRRDVDGTWTAVGSLRNVEIPSTVTDLIHARIAGLDREDRNLLDAAACCGFEFDPLLVAAALGLPRILALQRLARIEAESRVVHSAGRRYVFDHHQIHEVLRGELAAPLWAEYHLALASALAETHAIRESGSETVPPAVLVALCRHLIEGLQPARARPYLERALQHLEQTWQNEEFLALTDSLLAASDPLDPAERTRLQLRRAGRLEVMGRVEDERATLENALEASIASGDEALRADVERHLGWLSARTHDLDRAKDFLEDSRARFRRLGDVRGEAAATGTLGTVLRLLRRHEEARACHERHLAIARETGDVRAEGVAMGNLGNVAFTEGRLEEAGRRFDEALPLVRRAGDRRVEALLIGNLASVLLSLGDVVEARGLYERRLEMARESGDRKGEADAVGNLGLVHRHEGDYAAALRCHERRMAICRALGDVEGAENAAGKRERTLVLMGRHDEARPLVAAHLARARDEEGEPGQATALQDLADLAEAEGRYDEACRCLREAAGIYRRQRDPHALSDTLTALSRAEAARGDAAAARLHVEEAIRLAGSVGSPDCLVAALALEATLPGGDAARAAAALDRHGARAMAETVGRASYDVWKAGRDPRHRDRARAVAEAIAARLGPEDRSPFLSRVAWVREALGRDAPSS